MSLDNLVIADLGKAKIRANYIASYLSERYKIQPIKNAIEHPAWVELRYNCGTTALVIRIDPDLKCRWLLTEGPLTTAHDMFKEYNLNRPVTLLFAEKIVIPKELP